MIAPYILLPVVHYCVHFVQDGSLYDKLYMALYNAVFELFKLAEGPAYCANRIKKMDKNAENV